MPERIQLSRAKGWRKPAGAIVVSRPSKWGNPWQIHPVTDDSRYRGHADVTNRDEQTWAGRFDLNRDPTNGPRYWAVQMYKLHLAEQPELRDAIRAEIVGRDLACWCALDQPCHADVLLELANDDPNGATPA